MRTFEFKDDILNMLTSSDITNGISIFFKGIDYDFSFIKKTILDLKRKLPNLKINVLCFEKKKYLDNENDIKRLQEFNDFFQKNDIELTIYLDKRGLELTPKGNANQIIIAHQKIEELKQKINKMNTKYNLSVAEKFMLVYHYASSMYYNSKDGMDTDANNWIGVLSTDSVICTGFASLLQCLCDQIFTKNELLCTIQRINVYDPITHELIGGHANNLVYLKDSKYNMDGISYCDACHDCIDNKHPTSTYNYFLRSPEEMKRHKKSILKGIENSIIQNAFMMPDDSKNFEVCKYSYIDELFMPIKHVRSLASFEKELSRNLHTFISKKSLLEYYAEYINCNSHEINKLFNNNIGKEREKLLERGLFLTAVFDGINTQDIHEYVKNKLNEYKEQEAKIYDMSTTSKDTMIKIKKALSKKNKQSK